MHRVGAGLRDDLNLASGAAALIGIVERAAGTKFRNRFHGNLESQIHFSNWWLMPLASTPSM